MLRQLLARLQPEGTGALRAAPVPKVPDPPSEPPPPRSFFEREGLGLLERPHLAYGLARAAGVARKFGQTRLTVCEFGVAGGAGLLNLIELAGQLEAEAAINFRIVGFDTAQGLPCVEGPKDHPELWRSGDFAMGDPAALLAKIVGRAELILGDLSETVHGFVAMLQPEQPVGFVAIDVDTYSATVSALRALAGPPDRYLPAFGMYFDDVSSFYSNRWCGELAAIEEFNETHAARKIDRDRTLAMRGYAPGGWHDRMYVCHVLDHPERIQPSRSTPLSMEEYIAVLRANPYGYL